MVDHIALKEALKTPVENLTEKNFDTIFEAVELVPWTLPEFCAILGVAFPRDREGAIICGSILDLVRNGTYEEREPRKCSITAQVRPTYIKKEPELPPHEVARIAREMVDLNDLSPDPLKREAGRKWIAEKLHVSVSCLPPMRVLPGLLPGVDVCPHCHKQIRRQNHGYIHATEAVQGSPEPPPSDCPAGDEGADPDPF